MPRVVLPIVAAWLAVGCTVAARDTGLISVASGRIGPPVTPTQCRALGAVSGASTRYKLPPAAAESAATDQLVLAAPQAGGNYVRVTSFTWLAGGSNGRRGYASGTAFRCEEPRAEIIDVVCSTEGTLTTCSRR